jgi:hypothetical protein
MSQSLKAWLNYNCCQGNNWVVIYKFDEIVNHSQRQMYQVTASQEIVVDAQECHLTVADLSHIYFTHMTDTLLISLIETYDGRLYLIHNNVLITESEPTVQTVPEVVTRVDDIVGLPQIGSVESKIYHLNSVLDLKPCLSGKERKAIGLRNQVWLPSHPSNMKLKVLKHGELSFMSFINIRDSAQYLQTLDQYLVQSGETLNLQHNYSITPAILCQLKRQYPTIKQLVLYQNFQINDFQWLINFPNIKLINLFYNHQIEQQQIEQITRLLPNLEAVNIHFCTRINLRILIPILKLRNLSRLAIEDPQFWCQKGVHELFIVPQEWKGIDCPTLEKLAINSSNLTLDVIDYLIDACSNLQQIIVDEKVLDDVSKNIVNGFDKDKTIVFNSWQNPAKGFQSRKKLTFNNMLKDTYNHQLFSDSMMKKIKQIREQKGEVEQTSMPDKVV